MLPRPRPDVDHVVRDSNRFFVVLDDDERVPHVAEPHERVYQAPVVPLMQPDGRLVQHVEHPHQPRPDLRSQSDPLSLPTRERCRAPRQAQVVESHVQQKAKPGMNLLQQTLGDECFAIVELEFAQEVVDIADRQRAHLVDVLATECYRQRLWSETSAFALRARNLSEVLLVAFARIVRIGLVATSLEPRDDALEHRPVGALTSVAVLVADVDVLGIVAVENDVPRPLGQLS